MKVFTDGVERNIVGVHHGSQSIDRIRAGEVLVWEKPPQLVSTNDLLLCPWSIDAGGVTYSSGLRSINVSHHRSTSAIPFNSAYNKTNNTSYYQYCIDYVNPVSFNLIKFAIFNATNRHNFIQFGFSNTYHTETTNAISSLVETNVYTIPGVNAMGVNDFVVSPAISNYRYMYLRVSKRSDMNNIYETSIRLYNS